ncbi:MAG: triose-phosphate isomerase [Patescibacteria group bacterium]|nr:triose-phosphate isomerase [Patescibacteria group bacterium]
MKKKLIVGNWKMYIERAEEARALALALRRKVRGLPKIEVWVAPPTPFIAEVAEVLESSPVKVGAQRASHHQDPKHTGSVSAKMLKDVGASFVIVGHSEYRIEVGTNDKVRAELERTAEAGLAPILCVGEREREADGEHFTFIENQLTSALRALPPAAVKKLVVAYEPVWAIGKRAEDAMRPAELEEMVIFIRKTLSETLDRRTALRIPILYGGSVEPTNAANLITEGGVNGFLVGHASAQVESFLEIIKACK